MIDEAQLDKSKRKEEKFKREEFKYLLEKAIGSRSYKEYADECKINRTYISKFVNMKLKNPPSPSVIKNLADHAREGVTYEQLMIAAGYIDDPQESLSKEIEAMLLPDNDFEEYRRDTINKHNDEYDEMKDKPRPILIPVLSHVDYSDGVAIGKDSIESYEYGTDIDCPSGVYFYYIVEEGITALRICEDDLVLVHEQPTAENGDIVLLLLEDGSVRLRYYNKINGSIVITSDNNKNEPMLFTNKEFKNSGIKIIGKAINVKFRLNG